MTIYTVKFIASYYYWWTELLINTRDLLKEIKLNSLAEFTK